MSAGDDLAGLEDEPPVNCFTYSVVIQVSIPGSSEPGMLHDVEFVSRRPDLTDSQLRFMVDERAGPWLNVLSTSPRFRQRFGRQPTYNIVAVSIFQGC
jgi:hypothetical protein